MSPVPRPRESADHGVPVSNRGAADATALPGTPALPAPAGPIGTFPRRVPGQAADGRRWELLVDPTGICAVMAGATVGEAHIWTREERLTIEFWVDGADFPYGLSAHLVDQAFAHPAVRDAQPVLICLPRRDAGLLPHVMRHVDAARTHAAGMTCLIEGTVRWEATPAPEPRRAPV